MNAMLPATPAQIASVRSADGPEQGLGAIVGAHGALPLTAIALDAVVTGDDAELTLQQTFVNDSDDTLEVTYVFPLPRQAALVRARAAIGARTIIGEVKERAAARAAYDDAQREGRAAALIEQDRGDIFTLTLGNIGPRASASIELVLAQALIVVDDEVTFRFPFTIAPRYVPGTPLGGAQAGAGTAADTDAAPDASRVTPPVLLPGYPTPVRLSASVRVRDPKRVARVTSSIAAVDTSFHDGWWTVALRQGVAPDRDWVVRMCSAVDGELRVAADPNAEEGTFVLRLPPAVAAEDAGVDVVLLIDRSGSMNGWQMMAAREAALHLLDGLTPADRVAILAFDDAMAALVCDRLTSASAPHVARLREAIGHLFARGGTEMASALRWAAQCHRRDRDLAARSRATIVITDGAVADDDRLLHDVSEGAGDVRIHTVGICSAVNEGLLGRLSERTGGLSELVESPERMKAIAHRLGRTLRPPALSGGALALQGAEVLSDTLVPPPGERGFEVFDGRPLVVRGRYRGPAPTSATFTARRRDDTLSTEVVADAVDSAALRTLWARGHLESLEQAYAATSDERLEGAMLAHALAHQLPCRLTAWVAVSEERIIAARTPRRQQQQPSALPQGFSGGLLQDPSSSSQHAAKTRAGVLKGKFAYMSPEGVRGLLRRSPEDIFLLGLLLYELLTGERLYRRKSELVTLKAVADAELPAPLLPIELSRLVPLLKAMLARDPTARPTAADVLAMIDELLDNAEGVDLLTATASWRDQALAACAQHSAPADLAPGELRVGTRLAVSGMSEHFIAWWRRADRPELVVVRHIVAEHCEDETIRLHADVGRRPHPAFREVIAQGRVPDRHGEQGYARIEEMIWGPSLLELVRAGHPLSPRAALEAIKQVAEVLPVLEEGGSDDRLDVESLLLDPDGSVRFAFTVGPHLGATERPGPIDVAITWPDAGPRPPSHQPRARPADPPSFVHVEVSAPEPPPRRRLLFWKRR
jgi:Ca-activated chloride channel family protein